MALILIPSMTDTSKTYEVDEVLGTCTCMAFKKGMRPCKHIHQLKAEEYNVNTPYVKDFATFHPSTPQAMSGFIKACRLRRDFDMAYWLYYMLQAEPAEKFAYRIHNRILIMAGEDGVDIAVQHKVAQWFNKVKKNKIAVYQDCLEMALLITSRANWWAYEDGLTYMEGCYKAVLRLKEIPSHLLLSLSAEELFDRLEAVVAGHKGKFNSDTMAIAYALHLQLKAHYKGAAGHDKYVLLLRSLANKYGRHGAAAQADTVRINNVQIMPDDNYVPQIIARLIGASFGTPAHVSPEIHKESLLDLIYLVKDRYENKPLRLENYYMDGVHCTGNDRRFGGIIDSMLGVCRAFQATGEVNPLTPWPASYTKKPIISESLKQDFLFWLKPHQE